MFVPGGDGARKDVLAVADADKSSGSDQDQEAFAAHKKAKQQGVGQTQGGGVPGKSRDEVKEGGSTSNGSNRRTGLRNRHYKCDSEYHPAPKCPWRAIPGHPIPPSPREIGSTSLGNDEARRPSDSTISIGGASFGAEFATVSE